MAGVPPKLSNEWARGIPKATSLFCEMITQQRPRMSLWPDCAGVQFSGRVPKIKHGDRLKLENRLDHKKYRFVFNITFIPLPVSAIEVCMEVLTARKHSLPRLGRSFYWIVATPRSGLDFLAANCSACVVLCLAHCVMLQHPSQYYVITP